MATTVYLVYPDGRVDVRTPYDEVKRLYLDALVHGLPTLELRFRSEKRVTLKVSQIERFQES